MACSLLALSACKKNPAPSTDQANIGAVEEMNAAEADIESIAEENKEATADDNKDDVTANADTSSVALEDLYNVIAESVSLPEMYFADADFMLNYYGIDASKLEDYIFASCLDSTSVDSIILIRLKDEASANEVVDGLNMVLEQMNAEMENYNPEANELVKGAKVRRNGKNIDLIIHKDCNTILSIIDSTL